MNTSTTLTLNDRFSLIKKPNGFNTQTQAAPRQRSRSRSRSRGRLQQQPPQQQQQRRGGPDLRGSKRNMKLLTQLERQHKMRLALKLKNKSILNTRGRIQGQGQIIRNRTRQAGVIKKAANNRNLKRSNSLTTFVPLNDAPGRSFRGRSRSRSRSRNRAQQPVSIADRLGIRPRRMRRGQANGAQQQQQQQQQPQRSRSRSRVRLNRNNFANGRNPSNSFANGRNPSNNRAASRNPSKNRSASRNRNFNNQAPLRRANSVNTRLGNAAPTQIRRRRRLASKPRNPNTQLNKPLGGRIVKRTQRAPVASRLQRNARANGKKAIGAGGANARRGKIVKRGANNQVQARGRANARGGQNNQGGQGGARQGRSRTRRGANNNRGGGAAGRGQISKAQLDKQLDAYMAKGAA